MGTVPVGDSTVLTRAYLHKKKAAEALVETTGRKRDRSFMYRAYLDRLKVGTELEIGAAPAPAQLKRRGERTRLS